MSDRQERTQPDAPQDQQAQPDAPQDDNQPNPDTGDSGQGAGEQSGGTGDDGKTFDADYVRKLRDEAAKHRNEKNQTTQERDQLKSTIDQLRKALDPQADEQEDPAKVAERASQERDQTAQQLRERTIELAVHRQASKTGADADALLDSRAFLKAAGDLDPATDTFATDLESAIKSAVDSNSKLRSGQAPSRSGGEFTGGTGNNEPKFTREQIKNMSKDEFAKNEKAIHEAMAAGRIT